jgi:peptidoglycan/xylan/chitin deacetylase (PgdA/CDA1 family)
VTDPSATPPRRRLRVLLALVPMLAAAPVVAHRVSASPDHLSIEVVAAVDGAPSGGDPTVVRVPEGTTVAEVLAAAGVRPVDGRLLAAASGQVLDAHHEPAELTLDGRPITAATVVTKAARTVRVIDGADATEPTRTVEEEIPVPAGPDVLRRVEERGAPGRVRKEVGVRSGEVVDTEALVAARAPTTTTRKVVALTFDDGPSASWTPYVLEILRSRGVRATFCMVGTAVEKAPEVAAQVVAAGHQVCNHTQSHDLGLAEADQARVDAEVQGGRATMLAAGLPEPPFYRPPGGNLSDPVIATARAQGERVLMWKVDTRDWSRSATVESVLANLRSQVEPGAIVLLHDAGGSNRFTSLAVLAGLIDELRAQGYEFTFPVIDPA